MAFNEKDHPRDKSGQFTSKGGGQTTTSEKKDGGNKQVYDFDKWAKETNSRKEDHIAYIDTSKKHDPQSILKLVNSDDGWNIKDYGDSLLLQHKSGVAYNYDRNSGNIELTTEGLENQKGKEGHTKELTEYVKNAIKNGETDPEKIYQNSPYSIHSHDEIVELAKKYSNQQSNKAENIEFDPDYERSYGDAPDPDEDYEGYKKYVDSYKKWVNKNERKQASKLFDVDL